MSGTKTYKEHLQYSEKERTVKNIAFDPRHPRHLRQHFMDRRQNFESGQNFMSPR